MESIGKLFRKNLLTSVKEGVEKHGSTFLLSYSSVNASQMDKLRKDLNRVGAQVYVSKKPYRADRPQRVIATAAGRGGFQPDRVCVEQCGRGGDIEGVGQVC